MAQTKFAATGQPGPIVTLPGEYQPGISNIGPAEIASRRRAGHVGVIASIVLLVILVAIGAPPITRLLIALPAAVAASGTCRHTSSSAPGSVRAACSTSAPSGHQPGRRCRSPSA